MFEPLQGAELDFEVFFSSAGVVRFVTQEFGARGQFVAAHRRNVLDASGMVAKGTGLIKSKIIHRDHFWSGPKWDAVPAEQTGNFQVARRGKQTDQNQIGRIGHASIIAEESLSLVRTLLFCSTLRAEFDVRLDLCTALGAEFVCLDGGTALWAELDIFR